MRRLRHVLLLAGLALALFLGRPVGHLARVAWREQRWAAAERAGSPPGHADDASHLEATRVARVVTVPRGEEAALAVLRQTLAEAREGDLGVSIAGARHSMGGQSIAADGIVLDMLDFDELRLDPAARVVTAQGGATWAEVLALADPHGLSVAVMQSNSVFTIGGSLSVNCHGWQPDHAPVASTVRALRLLTAEGELLRCTRTENAELFAAVLGGYGLFGVLLDAELELVPNAALRAERFVVPVADYVATLEAQVLGLEPRPELAFGRLDVTPGEGFLREAILTVFRAEPGAVPAPLRPPGSRWLKRLVFRGSVGSDYGKELRWTLERRLGGLRFRGLLSRNQLLDEDLAALENADPRGTDILQEYFLPPEHLLRFLETLRAAVPRHGVDLLNVTLRDVAADEDTLLRYADRPLLALVLFFHQERTAEADGRLGALTGELLDAALSLGGRHYLPYRLQATPEQFHAAYPRAAELFAAKRRLDPGERFVNKLYATYGR
ncbi:MAG TPA: FAD-binding oxidoreductase [Planctomycetota bacterium]